MYTNRLYICFNLRFFSFESTAKVHYALKRESASVYIYISDKRLDSYNTNQMRYLKYTCNNYFETKLSLSYFT